MDEYWLSQGPRYNVILEGAMANWVTSKARQNLEGGLGVFPWKNLRPRSSDLLKTTLIFVPQLTLQVNLR